MILKNPRNISGRISRLNNALMIWRKTDLLRSLIFTGKKKNLLEQVNVWLLTQIILKYFQRFSNWFGWHVNLDSAAKSAALEQMV